MAKQRQIETTPIQVKAIGKWLRENLYLVQADEGGRFSRVLVRHLVKGNRRGEEVFYIDVPKKANDEWCESTGLEINQRLTAEASTLGGLQKYALYAFGSTDPDNHISRLVVRIDGQGDEDDDDPLASEGADKHGLVAQAMRHQEANAKINTGMQMTALAALQSMVNRQSAMIEKLMDARLESIDIIEQLYTKKHEREVEMVQAETKAKAIRDVASKLGLFIPALANKISGQNLFPVQANAVMMMVKGLVTSIAADETKMAQLMGMLSAEQQLAFMNVVEEVSKSVDDSGLPVDGQNGRNGATATHERKE